VILFLLAGVTDVLDGIIARKFNMVTSFGSLPIHWRTNWCSWQHWLFLPYRIYTVAGFDNCCCKRVVYDYRSILIYKKVNFVVQADWYGKFATVVFFLAIVLTILVRSGLFANPYSDIIVNIAVIIAVGSTLFAFLCIQLSLEDLQWNQNNEDN